MHLCAQGQTVRPVTRGFSKRHKNSGITLSPTQNRYSLNSATNATTIWPGTDTDLLVVDMIHEYELLRKVLTVQGSRVKRWLVVHDTLTFGEQGETPGRKGLWPAIEELLATKTFQLLRREENNNGLTFLERR